MISQRIPLAQQGSLPGKYLDLYIHDDFPTIDIEKRPMILICPGGGYNHTSFREAEIVAFQLMAMGYHAAVLHYSVEPARYPTALCEAAWAIKYIREHAEEWHVDSDAVLIQGCSAGGHLAASLGCLWKEPFLGAYFGLTAEEQDILKPSGMILSYPVITSGPYAHRGSFSSLLGEREEELSEAMSLEKRVTADTPRAFVWHTFTDETVPVENSLLFVMAMRGAGIPCEYHMFAEGDHGLSLASKLTVGGGHQEEQKACRQWIGLAKTWLEAYYPITMR